MKADNTTTRISVRNLQIEKRSAPPNGRYALLCQGPAYANANLEPRSYASKRRRTDVSSDAASKTPSLKPKLQGSRFASAASGQVLHVWGQTRRKRKHVSRFRMPGRGAMIMA